jgi:hypothetical protein
MGVSTELATAETSELSSLPVPVHLILALLADGSRWPCAGPCR